MPPDEPAAVDPLDEAARIAAESLEGSIDSPPEPETPPEPPPVEPETPPVETPFSFRDAAAEAGFDLSQYTDDAEAAKALAAQALQAQQHAERLGQYERYIAEQQAQQKVPEPTPDPVTPLEDQFWTAPSYDPVWNTIVQRDADGNVTPSSNVTPDILQNMQKWAMFQQMEQDKFWQNPFKYLEPYIDAKARSISEESIGKYEGSAAERQQARDIVAQNEAWMVVAGANGSRTLTDEGKIYTEAIRDVGELSTEKQHTVGMRAVEQFRKYKPQVQTPANVTAAHAAAKIAAVTPPAQHQPSAGGTVQPDVQQNDSLTLQQMLERDLKAAGITDNDLVTSY